jgi:hypothetical protein
VSCPSQIDFQTFLPVLHFAPASDSVLAAISAFDSFFTSLNPAYCMQLLTKLLVDNFRIVSSLNFK